MTRQRPKAITDLAHTAGVHREISAAVTAVRSRIGLAADGARRDPAEVRLVAVTKSVGTDAVRHVLDEGVDDVGENRVQEAVAKRGGVIGGRWHLIGRLQSNKAAAAARLFDVVHTVDSERLAERLSRARDGVDPLPVLIEVELTGIPGRTGVAEAALPALAWRVATLDHLDLRGLMTVGPPGLTPEVARPVFRRLAHLRDELEQSLGAELPELSMGMSGDYEVAVAEGSTMVRIGRALFGERRT